MPIRARFFFAVAWSAAALSWVACGGDSTSPAAPVGDTDAATDASHAPADANVDVATDSRVNPEAATPPGPDAQSCTLDTTYTYGYDGGLASYRDRASLTPPNAYLLARTSDAADGGIDRRTCGATLGCADGDASRTPFAAVLADFRSADVEAAFAASDGGAPFIFGVDQRPVDGPLYVIERSDGRAIAVGGACSSQAGCVPIPQGVAALATDLKALDQSEVARPSCSTL